MFKKRDVVEIFYRDNTPQYTSDGLINLSQKYNFKDISSSSQWIR